MSLTAAQNALREGSSAIPSKVAEGGKWGAKSSNLPPPHSPYDTIIRQIAAYVP
ncbi:MAG: hypothetical protein ABFD54_03900 [Armatimonadota bacterium]